MSIINKALKNVAKDTGIYAIGRVLVGLTGILSIKLYTSLFTPEAYGSYSIVSTTVNVVMMVLTGWLFHSSFRFLNDYDEVEEKRVSFYSTIFLCSMLITLISLVITYVTLKIFRNSISIELSRLIVGGVFLLGTHSNSMILFNLIRAKRLSGLYSVLSVMQSSFKLIVIYILSKRMGLGAESIFYGGIILDLVVSIPIIYKLKLVKHINYKDFSPNVYRRLVTFGYPLIGVSLTTWVLSTTDKYLIKFFRTSAEVGIYSISYSLVTAGFALVNTSLMLGIYPIILKTWRNHGQSSTEDLMEKVIRYYLIITLPTLLGLSVLAKPALSVLTSPAYVAGYIIIPWVAFGVLLQGLSEYITKVWELQENTKIIFRLMIISGIINVIANIIFIPRYGFYAAALTTAFSYLIYLLLAIHFSYRIFAWKVSLKSICRIALASGIMALALKNAKSIVSLSVVHLILGIAFGAIIYFAVLFVTGELKEEINSIKFAFKNRGQNHENNK